MGAKKYVYFKENILDIDNNIVKNDVGIIESESGNNVKVSFLRTNTEHILDKSKVEKFEIEKTGDRFEFKVCDRCYKHLETKTQFENNRLKKDNIITKRPSCRTCRKEKNGVNIPSKQKSEWEARRPVNGSLFTCPICQKRTIVGISKIVLDHNHTTGNVRGWLCESCNTGIGRFDDKTEIIQKAIEWLEKNNR